MFEGPHIEAEIHFLSETEGGRRSPLFSGYRGQFHYENDERPWDAVQEYGDGGIVKPGGTTRAYLTFASPQEHYGRISIGLKFTVREGRRIIGNGTVRRILDTLEQDAQSYQAAR